MVAPLSNFTAKFGLIFVLKLKNAFSQRFHFRAQVLLKQRTRDFQNSSLFERSACFYVTITKHFKRFQYFDFETDFLENKTFFKKLEFRFLVESSKIENALFPYKTAISETSVKTNKMVTIKWTYQKERSFASKYFIFLKKFFQYKNLI